MSKTVSFRKWLAAARLRTLPLALAAIILGSLMAIFTHNFNGYILFWSIITAICYQVLSNFANDLGDGIKGTDQHRKGEKRAIASGEITIKQMTNAVILFSVLSFISGTYLSWLATNNMDLWVTAGFVLLGVLAIFSALKYTLGKNAYGYSGWGDVFVLLFFGWVGVVGANFLHTNVFWPELFLPATAVGFLAMGVLNLNNMRDVKNDEAAGKHTLVVKLGLKKAKIYQVCLIVGAIILQLIFVLLTNPGWGGYLFLIILPALLLNVKSALLAKTEEQFDRLLKPLAISTLLFCILAGLGQNLNLLLQSF